MELRDYSENIISLIFRNMDKAGERLTISNLDLCEKCSSGPLCELLCGPCHAKLVYAKLSRYEDTGLSPEKIKEACQMPLPKPPKEEKQ